MVLRLFTCLLTLSLALILPRLTLATEIEGIEIADYMPAEKGRPSLQLNGVAKRKFLMFVDVYVGSLYVQEPTRNAENLLESDQYRRMEFNMLRNVRGRKIADAFYEGMRLNVTQEQAEAMESQIQQLLGFFDQRLKVGDKAVVEYIPGTGTRVSLAGKERGVIPGKDLFDAILSIWIGDYPVSADFKAGILGAEPEADGKPYSKFRERDF